MFKCFPFVLWVQAPLEAFVRSLLYVYLISYHPRNVPFRVRVRLARRRNEDEDSAQKLYTLVTHVRVDSFKGMQIHSSNVSNQKLLMLLADQRLETC